MPSALTPALEWSQTMDQTQSQRSAAAAATPSRSYQFHSARAPLLDLFNLYLGLGVSNPISSLFLFLIPFFSSSFFSIPLFFLVIFVTYSFSSSFLLFVLPEKQPPQIRGLTTWTAVSAYATIFAFLCLWKLDSAFRSMGFTVMCFIHVVIYSFSDSVKNQMLWLYICVVM